MLFVLQCGQVDRAEDCNLQLKCGISAENWKFRFHYLSPSYKNLHLYCHNLSNSFSTLCNSFSTQLSDKLIYRSVLEFASTSTKSHIIEMRHRCRDMEKEIGVQFLAA